MKKILIGILPIILLLSGCTTAGSAALSSAQMIYDRHNLQKKIDEGYTSLRAYNEIYYKSNRYKDTQVSIVTFNDIILLIGQIPDKERQNEIETIVKNMAGARTVKNLTEIAGTASTLTHASDSWITTKIKAKLIAINDIDPSRIKVITENGTVFLMGVLPREEAEIAVNVASNTQGVQKVVKIFAYLTVSAV